MAAKRFDAIIIGSGQAGKPLATELAGAGWHVALVEREHVGGTCVNVGCTPTKTMVASARVAYLARRAGDYGVRIGTIAVDQEAVRARKRAIVERFRNYSTERLQHTENLTLLFGEASFVDNHCIAVTLNDGGGERQLTAQRIVINVGGRPLIPSIPGLDAVPHLDSTSIMELDRQPAHLLVLGGGTIGLEFAQMFRRFGSDVTVIEQAPRLVAREDPDVSEAVREVLEQDGIQVETGAKVDAITAADAQITLRFDRGGKPRSVNGSDLLLALGRKPNIETLHLERAGVATDAAGYIKVDDTLLTNVEGIYALGDVKGGPAFTHISYDDFRILRDRWLFNRDARVGDRLVPNTTFIDPQLAQVGLSETEARKRGLDVRVAKMAMNGVARALEMDESRGFIKIIVDGGNERILGCTVLGIEGGEIMSMVQIAMMGKLPYTALRDTIFAHPTLAEGLNNVFLALDAAQD